MPHTEQGWLLAHRLLLAHLVQALRRLDPAEAQPSVAQATLLMLRQSLPQMTATLPPRQREQVEAAASDELARILLQGRPTEL
jgi:hypothetical protein